MRKLVFVFLAVAICLIGCGPIRPSIEFKLENSYLQESELGTYLVCMVRLGNRRLDKDGILKLSYYIGQVNKKYGTIMILYFGPGDYIEIGQEATVASAVYGPGGNLKSIGEDKEVGVGSLYMIENWVNGPTDEEFALYNAMAKIMRETEGTKEEIMQQVYETLGLTEMEALSLYNGCRLYMIPTYVDLNPSPSPTQTPASTQ
jgi:hypothetical protein